MSDTRMHPRMRERFLKYGNHSLASNLDYIRSQKDIALSGISRIIEGIKTLEKQGHFPYAPIIIPMYENILLEIEELNPRTRGFKIKMAEIALTIELIHKMVMDFMPQDPNSQAGH